MAKYFDLRVELTYDDEGDLGDMDVAACQEALNDSGVAYELSDVFDGAAVRLRVLREVRSLEEAG